jgi:hypothetical protein
VLAIATLFELCLVVASPLWHHNHHDPTPVGAPADRAPVDLHLCSTGDHASEGAGSCPVCLSQRLLTHGVTGPASVPTTTTVTGIASLVDVLGVGGEPPEPILPRGPPDA